MSSHFIMRRLLRSSSKIKRSNLIGRLRKLIGSKRKLSRWWRVIRLKESASKMKLGSRLMSLKTKTKRSLQRSLIKECSLSVILLSFTMILRSGKPKETMKISVLIKRMRSSTSYSRAPTISSSRSRVKKVSSKKETLPSKTRIRESLISKRRLRSLKSSSLCLITKSRSSREISVQESLRSRSSMSRLTSWGKSWSISTEWTRTWLWLLMIWEWDKKV